MAKNYSNSEDVTHVTKNCNTRHTPFPTTAETCDQLNWN